MASRLAIPEDPIPLFLATSLRISYNFLETFDILDHPILGMLSPSDGEDQISH